MVENRIYNTGVTAANHLQQQMSQPTARDLAVVNHHHLGFKVN